MKKVSKINISALFALLLAGVILTSAKSDSLAKLPESPISSEETHYVDDLDEYVDEYFDEFEEEDIFEASDFVKVYDENDELVVSGERDQLNEYELKILRQADLLIDQLGTAYYQLNN